MENKWGPSPAVADVPATVTGRQGAVLRVLRTHENSSGGVRVAEVADALGLHANTAREHLDALVDARLAVRSRAHGGGRGRPAWIYRPVDTDVDDRVGAYRSMAMALAGHLTQTSGDARAAARDLGRAWGRDLAADAEDGSIDDGSIDDGGDRARDRVIADLRRVGFGPVAQDDGSFALTRCPLLEAARRYPEVTCQLHLGLVRGLLGDDEQANPVLLPFARRGSCTLRLP